MRLLTFPSGSIAAAFIREGYDTRPDVDGRNGLGLSIRPRSEQASQFGLGRSKSRNERMSMHLDLAVDRAVEDRWPHQWMATFTADLLQLI